MECPSNRTAWYVSVMSIFTLAHRALGDYSSLLLVSYHDAILEFVPRAQASSQIATTCLTPPSRPLPGSTHRSCSLRSVRIYPPSLFYGCSVPATACSSSARARYSVTYRYIRSRPKQRRQRMSEALWTPKRPTDLSRGNVCPPRSCLGTP
jgi:hypothetical protein